ncbi:L-rhamnose mutarotase [soil metagenome]
MERVCFVLEIAPGTEQEYRQRHDDIWPEMAQAIRDSGISNMTGFRRGTDVYYYAECEPDVATAFRRLGETDVNTRWGESFEGVITRITDESGNLQYAAEVFHLD